MNKQENCENSGKIIIEDWMLPSLVEMWYSGGDNCQMCIEILSNRNMTNKSSEDNYTTFISIIVSR